MCNLSTRVISLLTLLLSVLSTHAEESNWPHPRGGIDGRGVINTPLYDSYEPAWTYATGGAVLSSAIAVDGVIYVGSEDKSLHAIDAATGERKWVFAVDAIIDASPVYNNGLLFIGTDTGVLHAIDSATGLEKWKYETGGRIAGEANVLDIADDAGNAKPFVLVGSHDGLLYCLDAATGQKRWTYETGDYINSGVILDKATQTLVLGGCDTKLHLIELATGKGIAQVELGGEVAGTPAISSGMVYIGHMQCEVVAVNLETHKVEWRFHDRDFPFVGSPSILKDKLLIGSRGRRLYALDPKTGEKLWDIRTQGGVEGSLIINDKRAAFGTGGGRLMIIDLEQGQTIWEYDLGSAINITPTPVGDMVVVGCEDGKVYAFKKSTQPKAHP